ncbi:MAG: tetratricopeptide repeat protein [Desulfobacteraceae bacterium]|nr:MAG: tetratricopeptide repeat protein [Desulfobacteraceae bacterium]
MISKKVAARASAPLGGKTICTHDGTAPGGPGRWETLFEQAFVLHAEGRLQEALDAYREALQSQPGLYQAFFNQGLIYLQLNQPEQAVSCYQKGVALNNSHHEAFFNLAQACERAGDPDGAVAAYRQALQRRAQYFEAAYNLGCLHLNRADPQEASGWLERAVALNPKHAAARNNLGQAYAALNQPEKAERCYAAAHALDPGLLAAACNLAQLRQTQNRLEEAVDVYRRTLAANPQQATSALNNLGNIYRDMGRYAAALECYRGVVARAPDLAEGHYNLGSALRQSEAYEEALIHLWRAVQLRPDYAEAWNNLALTCKNIGDLDRALTCFDRAVRLAPDMAVARWNRSFVHLLKNNYAAGWADFEWRFRMPQRKQIYPFHLTGTRWSGQPLPDAAILVHDEQGLGDTIQFVRYLPLVQARCREVILETRSELAAVLRPCAGVARIIVRSTDGHPAADYDFHVPLMSLPAVFQTTPQTIPGTVPYLGAERHRIDEWRAKLKRPAAGIRIGLVWSGRPQHTNDRNRSCALTDLMPLLQLPGVRFYGLQKGPGADQVRGLPAGIDFTDLGRELNDFSDTAAVLANLDLVISVDTAVVHLAGAMGRPVWVLIPFIPDWRWAMTGETTPWYPSMRLFRQTRPKDWAGVVERMRRVLEEAIRVYFQESQPFSIRPQGGKIADQSLCTHSDVCQLSD